jgi:hypothetical protein
VELFSIRLGRWLLLGFAVTVAGGCGSATTDPVRTAATSAPLESEAMPPDGPPPPLRLADGPYEQAGETDGVTVYEHRESELISVGAEGELPAPPEIVLAALLDYSRHAAVLERLEQCRVLRRGEDWLVVYQRLGLPLIDDRDFTLRLTWGKEADRIWIRFRTEPNGPAPVDGVVRVTRHFGGWDLFPADGGKATLGRYTSNIDLAGSLPGWMTKSGATDELPAYFRAMCSLLPAPHSDKCKS